MCNDPKMKQHVERSKLKKNINRRTIKVIETFTMSVNKIISLLSLLHRTEPPLESKLGEGAFVLDA